MAARGATHAEIGQHFNRSERTIRAWLKLAQQRRLVAFRGMSPEAMLAASETKLLSLQALLLQRLTDATAPQPAGAAGASVPEAIDNRGLAALVREVRGLELDRYRLRQIAGFFDGVRWSHPAGDGHDDHGTRAAEILREAIAATFLPEGSPQLVALTKPGAADEEDDDPII
jgi:transposase-like protein